MSKSLKPKNDNYIDSTGITHNRNKLSDILGNIKGIKIESPTWTYNTSVKFFTLPFSTGVHSYIITGVVSYQKDALYSNVMLLITQTNTNVKIDKIIGSNNFTADGIDLYVTNMQAQANLHLFGVCFILI